MHVGTFQTFIKICSKLKTLAIDLSTSTCLSLFFKKIDSFLYNYRQVNLILGNNVKAYQIFGHHIFALEPDMEVSKEMVEPMVVTTMPKAKPPKQL